MILLLSISLLALSPCQQATDRPNILLLFADDQRADTIAAWGNQHIRTPHIDSLVRKGISLRANYTFGSNSGAVCIPSRAMLMSGRTWLDLPNDLKDAKLLPETLRQAGYTTFATGKWHNGTASLTRAFPSAKSIFLGGMADHTQTPIADIVDGKLVNQRVASKFSSEEFADQVIGFLNSHKEADPFFCYAAFTAPHDPRNPPEEFRQPYYQNRPPLPPNFLPQHPFNNGICKNVRDENLLGYPRDRKLLSDQLCEYYGLITHLDGQVGRILNALEKSGKAKNTLVIYAADSGLALGSHGLLGKQSLYEHSMRCPLIIAGPGVPPNTTTQSFTYLLDLYPTLCQIAKTKSPENLAGHSLQSLWTDPKAKLRPNLFMPFQNLMRSINDGRHKLIVYPQINRRQLFDLQADPHETTDLITDARQAINLASLQALLAAEQKGYGDKQPLQVTNPQNGVIRYDDFDRKADQWQPRWIIEKYFPKP